MSPPIGLGKKDPEVLKLEALERQQIREAKAKAKAAELAYKAEKRKSPGGFVRITSMVLGAIMGAGLVLLMVMEGDMLPVGVEAVGSAMALKLIDVGHFKAKGGANDD